MEVLFYTTAGTRYFIFSLASIGYFILKFLVVGTFLRRYRIPAKQRDTATVVELLPNLLGQPSGPNAPGP